MTAVGRLAPPAVFADGLETPRRHWASLSIFLAMTLAVVDGMIANVALPSISRDLHASSASAVWIINAYQLTVAVAILPLAALGERLGCRRIYLAGLVVFTVGSLGCVLSHSLGELIAARVVQGLGGSGIMSVNAALTRFTYPSRMLGRGLSTNAAVISISAALGPTLASAVLAVAPWQWLFALNLPLGVVAIVIGLKSLPQSARTERPFDMAAAALSALSVGLMVLGADAMLRDGFGRGVTMLAVALGAGGLLVWRERAHPAPFVPLDLMRIPIFRLSIFTQFVASAAMALAYVALPFDLQGPLGRTVLETGLMMTPWPLATALAAPLSARMVERHSAGLLGAIGLGVMAAGLVLLAVLPPHPQAWDIAWRMGLCGAGFGFFQTPNNRAMLMSAPLPRTGAAGGMIATVRLLGQVVGAGAMGVLFHLLQAGAVGPALILAAAAAAVSAGVSLLRTRAGAVAT